MNLKLVGSESTHSENNKEDHFGFQLPNMKRVSSRHPHKHILFTEKYGTLTFHFP